ncbi:hypothetical protein [Tautonia sociabilis]|uniref:Uncharacterized protein n=1 Tax=Tautonia sociabilis TaxID=2080755 RepID=A0A432MJF5_9BACT|nr:hypothetical protein [Tautonia sociabilis]RUL87315.1 hypothetical protein TsocGM_13140 [Tautonia sociabilis]
MTVPTVCPHCGRGLLTDPGSDPPRTDRDSHEEPTAAPPAEPATGGPEQAEQGDSGPSRSDSIALGHGTEEPIALPFHIDLGAGPPSSLSGRRPAEADPAARDPRSKENEEEDDDGLEGRRSAWPVALLASYASAMTLACGWLWWSGHRGRAEGGRPDLSWSAGIDALGAEGSLGADAGQRDGESIVVERPEPIGEGLRVALGESLEVGALELTPLDVSSGPVELSRTRVDGKPERRREPGEALRLRLRLRNTSDEVVFAPLDEAFVREPDRRLPETFIEDRSGTRLYAFRLPVASEWGIVGQEFRALRPGESLETIVVSDSTGCNHLKGPLTWRIRVRTAPEETAVVGVAFGAEEIGGRREAGGTSTETSGGE